jgi:hypothetical protein
MPRHKKEQGSFELFGHMTEVTKAKNFFTEISNRLYSIFYTLFNIPFPIRYKNMHRYSKQETSFKIFHTY